MPTNRTPLRRRVRGELTSDMEMTLWLGASRDGFPFTDADEAEELWTRHKARLMEAHARNGHRPMAWWVYDAPEGLEFDYDTERSTLFEAGLLGAEEAAALVAEWRREAGPGFLLLRRPRQMPARRAGCRGAPAMGRHSGEPARRVERSRTDERLSSAGRWVFHVTTSVRAAATMALIPFKTWRMALADMASSVIPPAASSSAARSRSGSGNTVSG